MANPTLTGNGSMFAGSSHFVIAGGTFNSSTTQIHNGPKGGYERLVEAAAPNALHNSRHDFDAPKCHPGTRLTVIKAIMDWIAGVHDNPRKKDIAWVTGAAGAGKSAIGRTVCERCAEEGTLLASFFFGVSDSTRNHTLSLVPTLVTQICRSNPVIRDSVTKIIDQDPFILNISLREQLSTLFIGPLLSTFSNAPGLAPRVIVIDGLDECKSHKGQLEILDSLLYLSTISDIPIRFLVCSRPESQIVNFFSSPHSQDVLFKIYLGDEYSPDEDIRLYLSDRFKAIKQGHIHRSLIPDTWPEEDHMDKLVYNSSGQFIYASTVVYYVESPRHRPHQRLESVLGLRPPFKDLPFSQLNALYAHILEMTDDSQLVVDILALSAFYGDFSAHHAELMLMLEPGDVQIILADCASIVKVEPWEINNIILLHKSFSDFLRDPYRSKDFHRNYVDTAAKHISRVLEIFIEQHTGHRTLLHSSNLVNIINMDIPNEAWDTLAYQKALIAVSQFPMESFCKTLFSHNLDTGEAYFLLRFFVLLHKYQINPAVHEAYTHYIQSLCQCILDQINDQYYNDWKGNYALAIFYFQGPHRRVLFDTDNNFYTVLYNFSWNWGYSKINDHIRNIFQQLLTNTVKSRILARAAAFCFQYLSIYKSKLQNMPHRFRKIRQTRPWHWHRTFRSRLRIDQLLCMYKEIWPTIASFAKEANIAKKHQRYAFGVQSIFSVEPIEEPAIQYIGLPYHYKYYLEYFVTILPLAEPYAPLINMCKTKTLSKMSTFFPSLSRRARRAIADYLDRVGSALGDREVEIE